MPGRRRPGSAEFAGMPARPSAHRRPLAAVWRHTQQRPRGSNRSPAFYPPRRADTPGLKYRASFRPCGPRASSFHPVPQRLHLRCPSFLLVVFYERPRRRRRREPLCAFLPSIDPPGASNLPLRCFSALVPQRPELPPLEGARPPRPSMQWSLTWSWTFIIPKPRPSCP